MSAGSEQGRGAPRPAGERGRRRGLGGLQVSLRMKVIGIVGASGALVALTLGAAYALQMRSVLQEEMGKRGQAVGVELANNLAFATFSGDTEGLQRAAAATLRDIPDVVYVLVRGGNDELLAQATHADLAAATGLAPQAAAADARATLEVIRVGGRQVLSVVVPVVFEQQRTGENEEPGLGVPGPAQGAWARVGTVQLGLGLDTLAHAVSVVTGRALGLAAAVLLVCVLAAAVLARLLVVPLERLARAAGGIAAGDLRQQVAASGSDEIGALASSFATMASALSALLADLRQAAADIEREAACVLSTSSQQSAMAHQQASAINETSTTVAEIAQTSKQATAYADSVIAGTSKSEQLSGEGQKVVAETVHGMEKLGEQVKAIALAITELSERTLQIGDIIATVKDVAEQSNLLALNASIEAAKAGEHGRGFAVVAAEMRTLAEQSRMAATQVRGLLGEVQKGTRAAVAATEEGSRRAHAATRLVQSAGTSILGLAEVIRDSSVAARQIAGNTRQQTIGVEQIAAAMTQLSTTMADNVDGTRRIEQVAGNLSGLSKRFSELVARYQL